MIPFNCEMDFTTITIIIIITVVITINTRET